ncbi:hypothetical protein AOB60_21115 [Streptomyces noursei]|uniref:Uncharacterized protein n=1 Tax=Streptomyces noursei TaxID=1971 RepID=A0A2N8P7H2_STRNR|nr:hypothetical protein AOB60_21115 [Streptomyces noursei]
MGLARVKVEVAPFTDERKAGLGFEPVSGMVKSGMQLVDPMARQPVAEDWRDYRTADQTLRQHGVVEAEVALAEA